MKRALTLALAGMFALTLIGCRASAEVDDNKSGSDTSYKKTTTVERNGDSSVKVEKKTTY